MIDGYNIQQLVDNSNRINAALMSATKEINTLPKVPISLESWVESFSTQFKLSHFQKMFHINRQMTSLLEEQEANSRKLKIAIIDNVLDKINVLVGKQSDQ